MENNGYNQEENTYLVLDTETTGLKADDGDRVVEIGIIEVKNNKKTGNKLHLYIKPLDENGKQKPVGETEAIHGLSDEFLSDKPTMQEVMPQILKFIEGKVLVIHNAPFDVKFLEKELAICEKPSLFKIIKNVHCTLKTDERLYPKEKHKLDNICDRLGVDRTQRTLHGALLDAELLAECFIRTNEEFDTTKIEGIIEQHDWQRPEIKRFNINLRAADLTEEDLLEHNNLIKKIEEKNKKPTIFSLKNTATLKPTM